MDLFLPNLQHWASRIACGALLLVAQPVFAQAPAITPTESGLTVELAGHRLTFPPPVWTIPTPEPVAQAQTRFTELAPGVESLVLLPVDVTVITWTELMGILIVNLPGYSAETQMASVVDPISEACLPDQLYASTPDSSEASAALLMCGRYRLDADVPKRCGGGIILARVLESPEGAAKVYHEWCTSAFDAENRATWPVSEPDLLGYAELLLTITKLEPLAP